MRLSESRPCHWSGASRSDLWRKRSTRWRPGSRSEPGSSLLVASSRQPGGSCSGQSAASAAALSAAAARSSPGRSHSLGHQCPADRTSRSCAYRSRVRRPSVRRGSGRTGCADRQVRLEGAQGDEAWQLQAPQFFQGPHRELGRLAVRVSHTGDGSPFKRRAVALVAPVLGQRIMVPIVETEDFRCGPRTRVQLLAIAAKDLAATFGVVAVVLAQLRQGE